MARPVLWEEGGFQLWAAVVEEPRPLSVVVVVGLHPPLEAEVLHFLLQVGGVPRPQLEEQEEGELHLLSEEGEEEEEVEPHPLLEEGEELLLLLLEEGEEEPCPLPVGVEEELPPLSEEVGAEEVDQLQAKEPPRVLYPPLAWGEGGPASVRNWAEDLDPVGGSWVRSRGAPRSRWGVREVEKMEASSWRPPGEVGVGGEGEGVEA